MYYALLLAAARNDASFRLSSPSSHWPRTTTWGAASAFVVISTSRRCPRGTRKAGASATTAALPSPPALPSLLLGATTRLHRPAEAGGGSPSSSPLYDFDDDGGKGYSSFGGDEDALLLSYMSADARNGLPPRTKKLIVLATENYVYGTAKNTARIGNEVLDVVDDEYRVFDVPVLVDNTTTIDVEQTGDDLDESVAEVLSLAALHRLPKEIALELLGGPLPPPPSSSGSEGDRRGTSSSAAVGAISSAVYGNDDDDDSDDTQPPASTSLELCRAAFAKKGWSAVEFPMGLAIEAKHRNAVARSSGGPKKGEGRSRIISRLVNTVRRRKRRIEAARVAVEEAKAAEPPEQRIKSQDELLATMEAQFGARSSPPPPTALGSSGGANLLFFPDSTPAQGISWKRFKRAADRQYAKLKKKGRAGFVSYCFFNFLFYTAGVLWRWPRVAPGDPFSAPSAFLVCLRKLGRIFMGLYLTSQLLKPPRLFTALALAPVSGKCLAFTQEKLRISETRATILFVALMVLAWTILISVPFLAEYAKLRRIVQLERLIST